GDVFGTKITVGGASTSAMSPDYPVSSMCGGTTTTADAVYELFSSGGGEVRIRATPATGYDTVLALYDGRNGVPLRLVDNTTTTVNLNAGAMCGNNVVDWNEYCDDNNVT